MDFARFLTGTQATRRNIVRKYKYPNPAGMAQTRYYAEARAALREYHSSENDGRASARIIGRLEKKAAACANARVEARVKRNITVFEAYLRHFGRFRFSG